MVSYGGSSVLTTLIVFAIIQGLYMLRFTEIKMQEKAKMKAQKNLEKTRLKEEKAAMKKQVLLNKNKAGAKTKHEEDYDFEEW